MSRQIDSGYYERYMLSKEKLLPEPIKGLKENPFLDSYVIEFLDLPAKGQALVREWAEKHKEDVMNIWTTQEFKKLPPLK